MFVSENWNIRNFSATSALLFRSGRNLLKSNIESLSN